MELKVGDKVRLTADGHTYNFRRGNICTVVNFFEDGSIRATIEGGDGDSWLLGPHEYEPLDEYNEPEYNYAEQAAKYGITITVELIDGNVIVFDGKKQGENPDA